MDFLRPCRKPSRWQDLKVTFETSGNKQCLPLFPPPNIVRLPLTGSGPLRLVWLGQREQSPEGVIKGYTPWYVEQRREANNSTFGWMQGYCNGRGRQRTTDSHGRAFQFCGSEGSYGHFGFIVICCLWMTAWHISAADLPPLSAVPIFRPDRPLGASAFYTSLLARPAFPLFYGLHLSLRAFCSLSLLPLPSPLTCPIYDRSRVSAAGRTKPKYCFNTFNLAFLYYSLWINAFRSTDEGLFVRSG